MNFKKSATIAATVAALGAISVPAMALENEFHGMYSLMAYDSNLFNGEDAKAKINADPQSGFYAEQRARIQYIAKANPDLKLVTQFEMDARFGGKKGGYKGTTGNDSGNIDADQLTLETKHVYLDFNCPLTGANVKAGIQPWKDSYQALFLLADMTGVQATKKAGQATLNLGWFRFDDNTVSTAAQTIVGRQKADLFVLDGKFAVSKDVTVGASYYNIQNDVTPVTAVASKANITTGVLSTAVTVIPAAAPFELLHMVGLNASVKAGPATIQPFFAYQFGDINSSRDLQAFAGGLVTKINTGSGAVNLSGIYLSGDKDPSNSKQKSFTPLAAGLTYFGPANMWLLVRNGQGINTSDSILNNDLTVGGRGLLGLFAGYEGTAGKVFYNTNVGYAQTNKKRGTETSAIGTELNAQVGYKLFDNLKVSTAFAYAILADGMNSDSATDRITGFGVAAAENPYALNLQLAYNF